MMTGLYQLSDVFGSYKHSPNASGHDGSNPTFTLSKLAPNGSLHPLYLKLENLSSSKKITFLPFNGDWAESPAHYLEKMMSPYQLNVSSSPPKLQLAPGRMFAPVQTFDDVVRTRHLPNQ
ncbi:hypothetical protein ACJJTC_002486 [Scirpophaga incertulas]